MNIPSLKMFYNVKSLLLVVLVNIFQVNAILNQVAYNDPIVNLKSLLLFCQNSKSKSYSFSFF